MKKINILLMLLIFISSMAFGQVEKGKWMIGGSSNLGIDIGKVKQESNGGNYSSEYKYSQFNLSPQVGYFVIDKLPVGLFMDYEYDKQKSTDSDNDNAWKTTSFTIGPFVRYYILEYKKLWPYVEGRAGFGSYKDTEEYGSDSNSITTKLTSMRLGGGATYFVSPNVGLDLFVGYKQNTNKYEESSEYKSSSEDVKDIESSFGINLGIVVTFGK